ncbi:hypothetical protein [Bradyrhizobium sp. USDA 4350]
MNIHPVNLTQLAAHLTGRWRAVLAGAVEELEAGIARGSIRNVDFTAAKDNVNRAIEEGAEAFLASGPHVVGRNGQPHPQSDWWLDAYDADAFVHGASNVASALKRAKKVDGLKSYAAFLAGLMPLVGLVDAAKPLIVKRQDQPKTVTPKQAAKLAKAMTCQCCGRKIFAETGSIAHHGYERPGGGWQTASCPGARELPFEVDRAALGALIRRLQQWETDAVAMRVEIDLEYAPVIVTVADKSKPRDRMTGGYPSKAVELTRATDVAATGLKGTFDDYKADDLRNRAREIEGIRREITAQKARFDSWKQTHEWDEASETWKAKKE